MDPYTWTGQGCPTSKNLHQLCVDTGCSLEDLQGVKDDRERKRESQGNPCCQCDLMMIKVYLLICQVTLRVRINVIG